MFSDDIGRVTFSRLRPRYNVILQVHITVERPYNGPWKRSSLCHELIPYLCSETFISWIKIIYITDFLEVALESRYLEV